MIINHYSQRTYSHIYFIKISKKKLEKKTRSEGEQQKGTKARR